jgi:hypothetical protein
MDLSIRFIYNYISPYSEGRGAFTITVVLYRIPYMDIKTYVKKNNLPLAKKLLKKRGAWGEFVNKALENYKS